MGAIIFNAEQLCDSLSEIVGYKAGLAVSVDEMCDLLSGSKYPDILLASEQHVVRLRAEEYEQLFYKLMHRVGYTKEEFNGDVTGMGLYHKYKNTHAEIFEDVTRMFNTWQLDAMNKAMASGEKGLDPRPVMLAAHARYGKLGATMVMERIEAISRGLDLSPSARRRAIEWTDVQELKALFKGGKIAPAFGEFFDQRYIDFLSNNPDALGSMHWRKFEEMTAEYFVKQGFKVELGPGGNDDGVDVRFWKPDETDRAPHGIVQCKRQKDKIERVVVKGLMADVMFEEAQIGLIVTSSELSRGARENIAVRGYPIQEVNKENLVTWLQKLRTPGTGIVRT